MEPTPETIWKAINSASWTFAKSMPWMPHYYTLKRDWRWPTVPFVEFVQYIEDHGVWMKWKKTPPRRYLDVGPWRYWHMSSPEEATLVNRQLIAKNEAVLCLPPR